MTPQTQAVIQGAINNDPDQDIGEAVILDRNAKPITVIKAKPLAPVIQIVTQTHNQWYQHGNVGPTNVSNICITDGGGINLNATVNPSQIVTLTNFYNNKGSDVGGMYFILLWPPGDMDSQQAIPKLVFDNTACTGIVHQGQWEAAIRGKCDDATFNGVFIEGFPNGKPPIEIRHGKSWVFNGGGCENGYPEIGQQKVALPGGGGSLVTSQHIGTVTFTNFKFGKWTPMKKCYDRKPGVDRIVCVNCIDPSGKTFNSDE